MSEASDRSPARPEPDEGILRREALDAAVRSQRGPETGAELVAKAETILAFLQGHAVRRPGTLVLEGADVDRVEGAIVRGGLRNEDVGDLRLGSRLGQARREQEEIAYEAAKR